MHHIFRETRKDKQITEKQIGDIMIELKGKRNSAIIFAEKIDKEAKTQLAALLREEAFADAKIRIMPDVHAGKNAVVGEDYGGFTPEQLPPVTVVGSECAVPDGETVAPGQMVGNDVYPKIDKNEKEGSAL